MQTHTHTHARTHAHTHAHTHTHTHTHTRTDLSFVVYIIRVIFLLAFYLDSSVSTKGKE